MHVDWGAAATIIAVVLGAMWSNRRDTKKRHMENLKRFDAMSDELSEYPPHEHMEMKGTLSVEGVRMRRARRV